MKRLIIGDIHGCYDELVQLITKAELTDDDEIIALGDLVDRGPQPEKVIQFFASHDNAYAILGNHEHKHLVCSQGTVQPDIAQKITQEQLSLDSYQGLLESVQDYPLFIELPDAVLIHGAMEPGIACQKQKKNVLLGTRNGEAYLRKHYHKPWYELYSGEKAVIAGHHDYSGRGEPMVVDGRVFLIDTGCCYGKYLSGILLPDFRIYQVKSRKNYWGVVKQHYLRSKNIALPQQPSGGRNTDCPTT